jgi:hypothetical protein
MARKRSSFPFPKLLKKSSLTGLILLLIWTLYQFAQQYHPTQPIKLPSSNTPVELYSNQTQDDLTHLSDYLCFNISSNHSSFTEKKRIWSSSLYCL